MKKNNPVEPPKPDIDFTVSMDDENLRLDSFLKKNMPGYSRNQVQKWIAQGAVLCNGKPQSQSAALKAGDVIQGTIPPEEMGIMPEKIELDILHEDPSILVVNKPAGMVTHPGSGNFTGTLANAVAYHLKKNLKSMKLNASDMRPGIVHRLDKETSGVMVIAKNTRIMEFLSRQFEERKTRKVYRAIVCGAIGTRKGEIEGAIGKEFRSPKMAVVSTGRYAKTDFKVLKNFSGHTYIEVIPKTGRTHQIRVHLSKIGYPVLGDKIYGPSEFGAGRQMLHAYSLSLTHPSTKKEMTFNAPLPKDFIEVLKTLKS